ncbi:acyl-CoA dehydrogenase [Nocardioides sp. S5]|uniref:acyl-CoA dehydrogenase family protein n=1 Tax=Nocardioides sp. S5 TaxID=2017486 RepID=UPI001A8BFCDF|nr:acyl-CoA dehydrogenase family protein [Nocardioides sp. S5]QSR32185.1 acyl-CoA dehydrogenase [Nocardioides sp. S5]
MTDERDELRQMLTSVLSDACSPERVEAAEGTLDSELWKTLTELELLEVGRPEAEGGAGGDLTDAAAIVRLCAAFAAPVPVGDALLVAPWLRARTGLPHRSGAVVVVSGSGLRADSTDQGWLITGSVSDVPWAAVSDSMILLAESSEGLVITEVDSSSTNVEAGTNAAGEPCGRVTLDAHVFKASVREVESRLGSELDVRRALATSLLLAGALDRVLDLCVRYVKEREQFGKPLASFQSVRQQISLLTGEVLVAGASAEGAVQAAMSEGPEAQLAILSARVRSARSATTVATIAHQIHGAIGFTREHRLQHFTRRLWSWRDENGTEGQWEQRLGELVRDQGADALWPSVTQT